MISFFIGSSIGQSGIATGTGGGAIPTTLYYFPILGQSQAGGYNASPALTTVANSNVKTLTNGPIDVNTSGSLIDSVEGDTFSDTGGPAATPNIETIATSFAQQLRLFAGSDVNHRFAVTVHATGGTTIQQLSKGTTRYNELMAAVSRMKVLADGNSWNLVVHPIFFHGGTGDNVTTTYKAKLLQLYTDLNTDINAATGQSSIFLFTHQQRPAGTPDYGQQQYEASQTNPNIIVVSPEYKTTYQGDGIHLTNHGERYMAMQWARAIYYKVFSTGFKPLELDISNAVLNAAGTTLTIPILNGVGTLVKTTNCGIELFSSTTSAVIATTAAISGSNLVVSITSVAKPPIGTHNLIVRTAVAANGELHDSSSAVDVTTFLDAGSSPYNTDKYLVRAEYLTTQSFPVNAIISLIGGGVADPGVSGVYEFNDNVKSTTTVNYTLQGNVVLSALNTATNYWGFTASGVKGGTQTLTGTNLYNNAVLREFWFVENKSVDNRISGLNPAKTYTLKFSGLRTGTATLRQTIITIGATSIQKDSNRSGTDSVFTTSAEQQIFTGIAPDGSGNINFTVNQNSTQFGYVNVIEITQE